MKLAIVILNWNASDDTIRCVREITAWTEIEPVIIVVDNASTPEDVQALKKACSQIYLIESKVNLGFAGGNNLGITASLNMGDMPVLLLNNDAAVTEKSVAVLLKTLRNQPNIGLIGPVLYDATQKDRLLSAGSKDPAKHHHSHNHQLKSNDNVQFTECVPGTIIIIKSEVFRSVGLLDETYFFSSEIADICLSGARQGFLSAIDTRAKGYHAVNRSSRYRDTLYPYYIVRNRFLLVRKFHEKWKALFLLFWGIYGLALSLKAQITGKTSLARAVRQGTLDGLQNRFGNQNKRILAITMRNGHKSKRETL